MALPLYVVERGHALEVLGGPVPGALVCNRPLRAWHEELASRHGLELRVVRYDAEVTRPAFVIDDDVFCTARAFDLFARAVHARGCDCVAGLASHPDLDVMVGSQVHTVVKGGYVFGLRYLASTPSEPAPVLLAWDSVLRARTRVPAAMQPARFARLPQSTVAMLHVRAPLHLYMANMHQLMLMAEDLHPRFAFQRRNAPRHDRVNRIDPSADVHPTAWLHNCHVGAGAEIGAYAVCRNSVIGDFAQVLDAAQVSGSVIGAGAQVSHQYRVVRSVMYPDSAVVSGALQFSLLGEAAAVFAAWVTDVRMDHRRILAPVDGKLVDSGLDYLGVTLGHGARLTAGVVTAPGRVVPNGVHVHPSPDAVFAGLPPGHARDTPFRLG